MRYSVRFAFLAVAIVCASGCGKPAAPAPPDAAAPAPSPAPATSPAPTPVTAAPSTAAPAAPPAAATSPSDKLYTVVDGTKVDEKTMEGFRTWRAGACDRCHGANQEGMVGPSLVESLKTLTRADFDKVMKEGRAEKGMPGWNTNEQVMRNLDNLYAYLKGRSDGAITQARVSPMQ